MTELTWLIVGIWALLMVLYAVTRQTIFGGSTGAIGSFLALSLLADSIPLGFVLILLNIYILYHTLVKTGETKQKR